MKTPSAPIIVLILTLGLVGKGVSNSLASTSKTTALLARKKSELAALQSNLSALKTSYEQRKTSSQAQEAFLLSWTNDHKQTSSAFGTGIYSIAEKLSIGVRDLKQGDYTLKTKARSIACQRYTCLLVGSYSSIVRLLGDIESNYSLASFQNISLGRRLMDVELNFTILIPNLESDPTT